MKAKILFLGYICGMFLLGSCYKESDISPSYMDRNWYILEDSENPLDHQRYLVYKEYGIPIFYKDTIGVQERGVDAFGEPVIYYEVIDPDYTIETMYKKTTFELSDQEDALIEGVKFIKDRVIPELISPVLYPRCFLLVKKVTLSNLSSYEGNCFRGMMTTLVSHVEKLKDMSDAELNRLAVEVVGEQIGAYLADSCIVELESFINVSRKEVNPNGSLYAFRLTGGTTPKMAPVANFGFLSFDRKEANNANTCQTVTEQRDVMDYVTEVYMNDDAAFKEKYKDYPYVLKKYDLMKKVVADMKARFK